jgi:hypothetical protein
MQEIIEQISKTGNHEKIPPDAFIKIEPKQGDILFVDGGNAELAGGADFSVQFIRVAGVIFNGKEKVKTGVSEFYALFYLEREKDKIVVKTKISAVRGNAPDEKNLVFYFMNQEFSSFADAVRKICEINIACRMAENEKPDLVVLDGTLETKTELEKIAIERLIKISRIRNAGLCALSKTTSMVSFSGESLPFLIGKSAPKERFFLPVSDAGNFRTFIAKLHPDSDYLFRCDLLPETSTGILGEIAFISNDPVFLGYPYGLIEADKIARVSNREKEILRIEMSAKMGKKWLDLEEKERAVNAHSILDNML